jgi:hypothetical protein
MLENKDNKCFKCDKCDKTYKSRTGLWKHNLKCVIEVVKDEKEFICNYCNKIYNNKYSKYKHQKKCKINNNQMETIKEELTKIKSELEIVKNKPATINNINNIKNINKGIINKGVMNYIKPPGSEDISLITEKEAEKILENEMNCLIALVDYVNFNEKYPENHSFCTTALNDKYISTINTETLTIEKQRKKDFFDLMLTNSLKVINVLYDKLKSKKNPKALKYKENIDKLTDFVVVNNKGKKAYVEMMNTLSFNKRHLTQTTWDQLLNNEVPIKPIIEFKEEAKLEVVKPQVKQSGNKLIPDDSDSDSELSDSELSESDDSDSDEPIEMKVQGILCLLDGTNLYKMTETKQKGELYGTFINGKVKKIKQSAKEIDL